MPDFRPHILAVHPRTTIRESHHVPHLNTTVRFLRAVPADLDVIFDYICDVQRQIEPMNLAINATEEELREWHAEEVPEWMNEGIVVLATDCFEIVGLAAGKVIRTNGLSKRPVKLEDDYVEKIAACPLKTEGERVMRVFVDEIESFIPNFLPADCSAFFQIDCLSVRLDYQRAGIGAQLWKEILRLVRAAGITHASSTCIADGSTLIAKKFGMKAYVSIPYADFRANGAPPFGSQLPDGSAAANLMVGGMDAMAAHLDVEEQVSA
ncbi:hypothetical protein M3Y99_00102500 [Aphelenchoides fujianensis]|nr:hypothetical protein M3Y99_00102500 [Aphelenchoides fujianensis]